MSRSGEFRFGRRGFLVARVLQICGCMLFVRANPLFGFGDRLEPRDKFPLDFSQRFEESRTAIRYLPPEYPDFLLPEVIDNRARNVIPFIGENETAKKYPKVSIDTELRTPLRDAQENMFRQLMHSHMKPAKSTDSFSIEESNAAVKIKEISCRNSGEDLFFRASLTGTSSNALNTAPVVEDGKTESCGITRMKDEYRIDFGKDKFRSCGVVECSTETGKYYCLALRFPKISGLRLKEDVKITLRCKLQEKTASRTKRIRVKTLNTAARMAPSVLTGGLGNSLETDVGLFRKTYTSENVFDARIQSGGTVVLGEEVLLRASVKEGDGWRYSKIGEVSIHYIERKQGKNVMHSLWILDKHGCLNPDVREISSREQYKLSPLESYLIFQAFMFDDMKEDDEMIMTVKVIGCLDGADCVLDCPAGHVRKSRSVGNHSSTIDWQNDIAFKVTMPNTIHNESSNTSKIHVIPYIIFLCALLFIIFSIYAVKYALHRKSINSGLS